MALAGPDVARDDGPTVAVVPLRVEGPLADRFVETASTRIIEGVNRGQLAVVSVPTPSPPCEDAPCWAALAVANSAQFVLQAELRVEPGQRSYAFSGRVLDARGQEAFVLQTRCDLCGFEEAIGLAQDKFATTADLIQRLEAEPASLSVTGTPLGAQVSVDTTPVGPVPVDHVVEPGPHEVVVEQPGFSSQSFTMDFAPGVRRSIEVRLVPAPQRDDPTRTKRRRARLISGAVLTGASVVALVAGGVLVGLHDRPYRAGCEADIEGNCRFLHGTRPAGIASFVGAGVGLAVGIPLLVW